MPLIWCAISGHGFGHAAQVVPVLNALGTLVPGITTILRTTVPASFFRDRLAIGRKVAIQVLEFFDKSGLTIRQGDTRRLRPDRLALFPRQ